MATTTAEKIAVMQSFEEGKEIECDAFTKNKGNDWYADKNPEWDWVHCRYRIKKEKWTPPSGEYSVLSDGKVIESTPRSKYQLFGTEFKTEQDAIRAQKDFKFAHWMWHLANELNDGWLPDWKDSRLKYSVICVAGIFRVIRLSEQNHFTAVFKSKETAEQAIEIMKQWGWYFGEENV